MTAPGSDVPPAIDITAEPVVSRESRGITDPYIAPVTSLEQTLATIWAAALRVDRVGLDDDMFELGLDSLAASAAIVAIEDRTGHRLAMGAVIENPTLRAIAARLGAPSSPAISDLVIAFRAQGTRPPLFIVHGGSGMLWLEDRMLEALGADQPVFGIIARGIQAEAPPHQTIAAMAGDYAAALRRAHPVGPYILGGVCIGGLIARHMAQDLCTAGDPPVALLLVDPLAQDRRPRGLDGDVVQLARTDAGAQFLSGLEGRLERMVSEGLVPRPDDSGRMRLLQAQLDIRDAIERAVALYQPSPYPGRAEFFLSDISYERLHGRRPGSKRLIQPQDRVWRVAHDHVSMIGRESGRLGRVMRAAITEWLGGSPATAALDTP